MIICSHLCIYLDKAKFVLVYKALEGRKNCFEHDIPLAMELKRQMLITFFFLSNSSVNCCPSCRIYSVGPFGGELLGPSTEI